MSTSSKQMANEKTTAQQEYTSATKGQQQAAGQTTVKNRPTGSTSLQSGTTRITVHFNPGFGNSLFLRGDSAGLSWEQGIPMRNIDANTWIWETDRPFNRCNFKVLINDRQFENGENQSVVCHGHCEYSPAF